MSFTNKFGTEDVSPYQVHSRREIVGLLRSMHERNQLVTMQAAGGAEAVVTSILDVDEEAGIVVVDRAPSNTLNQRLLGSDNISFETVLDNIRILFFSNKMRECLYDNLPALYIAIPPSLIRLQRREYYRVTTPVANPVRCTIRIPADDESGAPGTTVIVTLKDISGGGVGVIDEKKMLDNTIGRIYADCRIDIPGGTVVNCKLQVRNSHDLTLTSGKSIRKVGCMFVNLPSAMLAAVQRYITKLERERNAKATGMT
ncbi:flagellar brake protein [Noviherbaspirillum denitrificans]|uniref:Flagellar brake protein YcgR n=1 Tax=Noviherbaspirillum denitrificans TaxID=1968433 RepID=A0A254TJ08_9BURK|nr:flagellar brake protein [Noviherbaspirillum denitrificans]OWW21322.1 flagellar brake protein [Noviherbaspirillum denitrificans]